MTGLTWLLLPLPDESHTQISLVLRTFNKNARHVGVVLKMLPLTLSEALLDTVPNVLLAVQVNTPESSGKTSAITKVQISSKGKKKILTSSSLFGFFNSRASKHSEDSVLKPSSCVALYDLGRESICSYSNSG